MFSACISGGIVTVAIAASVATVAAVGMVVGVGRAVALLIGPGRGRRVRRLCEEKNLMFRCTIRGCRDLACYFRILQYTHRERVRAA
ncbi:hypothetical protein EON67_08125 [archaeon]|nr:MAG: hypothetical protein EON67_08125 [archaeon]